MYFFRDISIRISCPLCWVLRVLYIKYRRRQWQPTPVLLPGKSHGWRSLVGCSPWGHKELDTTKWLHFHFSLSCIGEGNGNPLQCSCLENPRDGGAWWATVYGVTQSRTRLKRLSSRSSSISNIWFTNFYKLSFSLSWWCHCNTIFDNLQFIYFFLLLLMLLESYLRSHCLIQEPEDLLLCFLSRVLQF